MSTDTVGVAVLFLTEGTIANLSAKGGLITAEYALNTFSVTYVNRNQPNAKRQGYQ